MKKVWIACTDGYKSCYTEFGKVYDYDSDAISVKAIFDSELHCRRYCMENNFKCKEFNLRVAEEEVECGDEPILTWPEGVR